jgi:hypothetical protein
MKTSIRSLWLAYVMLLAAVVGAAGGLLSWASGDNPARAVITGGATFTATVTVALLILSLVSTSPGE